MALLKRTLSSLRSTLTRLKASVVDGVPGVMIIRGKKKGKILGITACTHGNEPSGLAVIDYLLNTFKLAEKLEKGDVYLAINNLKAVENYFLKGLAGKDQKYRFLDMNMNRLPENLRALKNDTRYEVQRARELLRIWNKFDVGFDTHSTSQDSPPMLIGGRIPQKLVYDFPIKTVLTDIDRVQIGQPAFAFYGSLRKKIPVIEIEAGGHEDVRSLRRAQECALRLLKTLGMISALPREKFESPPRSRSVYKVVDSVIFPDTSYKVRKQFKDGEKIAKGQVLAEGTGKKILAKSAGHVFFCPKGGVVSNIAEEAVFLTKPVVIQKIK